jgi:hypothetical protein
MPEQVLVMFFDAKPVLTEIKICFFSILFPILVTIRAEFIIVGFFVIFVKPETSQ